MSRVYTDISDDMGCRLELGVVLAIVFVLCGSQKDGVTIIRSSPEFVAFSAGTTKQLIGDGRMYFDRVFLNIGRGFTVKDSNFTAPVGGIYYIQIHAENMPLRRFFLDVYKNQQYLISIYQGKERQGQSGNSIVIDLLPGDSVYSNSRDTTAGVNGQVGEVYCTFSGHLLVPTFQVSKFISDPSIRQ